MRVGNEISGDRFAAWPRSARTPGERDAAVPGAPAARAADERSESAESPRTSAGPRSADQLTEKEQAQVARLRARDTEVRNHEAAHQAAAGSFGGGASYTYVTGPDGNRYAVGGEVPVRMVGGRTPEEAIRNAAQVRAAALAPADPSSQDLAVAAEASAMEADARTELAAQRSAEAAAADPARRSSEARRTRASETGGTRGDVASATGLATDDSASASIIDIPVDSEATMRQLEQERRTTRGSWRHLHMASGCGSCAAAVSSYT